RDRPRRPGGFGRRLFAVAALLREEMYGKFRRDAQVFQSPAVARVHRGGSRDGDLSVRGDLPDGLERTAIGPSVVQRRRSARIELAVTPERSPRSIAQGMNTHCSGL